MKNNINIGNQTRCVGYISSMVQWVRDWNVLTTKESNDKKELKHTNSLAKFLIQSALDVSTFPRIAIMKKDKEAWDTLQCVY